MIISHDKKLGFLHIQKTAGKSVREVLKAQWPGAYIARKKHARMWHIAADRAYRNWPCLSDYYVFAFVRNPWDRLVSWYHFMRQGESKRRRLAKEMEFKDWLVAYGLHNLPTQATMLCKLNTEELLVDFVGKFENLQSDFNKVGELHGFDTMLPVINTSKHDDYHVYYDKGLAELVGKHYELDCRLFGYSFNDR